MDDSSYRQASQATSALRDTHLEPGPGAAPRATEPPRRGAGWGAVAALGAFVLLAGLLTWPRLANATTSVVDPGDPLEDIWTLRWIDHALLTDPARLYAAPIF